MDVISELIGVPPVDRAEIRRLADLVVHREDGLFDVPQAGMDAALTLVGYYQDMVDERRGQPADDLTSALLEAELDGDKLTDEEIVAFLFLMVVAGNETTTKLLGNAWFWAWRHPDQRAKPFADPAGWPTGSKRPSASTPRARCSLRVARIAVALHGATVAEAIGCCCWSARPTATSRCSPIRTATTSTGTPRRLVSFGSGRHFCMGAPLARMEARIGLGELVKRVATYDIDADRHRAGPLDQRPRLATLPTTVSLPLMPRFEPNPERRPAVVTGASSGHRRGDGRALAARSSGGPRGPTGWPVRRTRRPSGRRRQDVAIHFDLADGDSVEPVRLRAVDALGAVEILVSNAAQNIAGTVLDTDPMRSTRSSGST